MNHQVYPIGKEGNEKKEKEIHLRLKSQQYVGHKGSICCLILSKDGKYLVSGGYDSIIRIWNTNSHECIASLKIGSPIKSLCLSPNGEYLMSGSDYRTIRIWNMTSDSHECITILDQHKDSVTSLCMSPDSEYLVSGSKDKTIRIWNMKSESFECIAILEDHENIITSLCMTPDGEFLVSGSWDRTIRIWNMKTQECLAIIGGEPDEINSLCISPDGKYLVSGSRFLGIRIWNMKSEAHECLLTLTGHANISRLCMSANGEYLLGGGADGTLRIWNMKSETHECIATLQVQRHVAFSSSSSSSCASFSMSPDGEYIVSGDCEGNIQTWNTKIDSQECIATLHGHESCVLSLCMSLNREYLVSGSQDNTIRIWNMRNQFPKCIATLQGHNEAVASLCLSSDGEYLVSGSYDSTIRIWNMKSETHECLATLEGHVDVVTSLCMGSAGEYLVSGSKDKTIRIWKKKKIENVNYECESIQVYSVPVNTLCLSSDGEYLVTGILYKGLEIRKLKSNECRTIPYEDSITLTSLCISSDREYLVSGSGATIRIWSLKNQARDCCVGILKGHEEVVWSLCMSSDDAHIVSGSLDNTIRIWNLESHECISILRAHQAPVTSLCMSSNGEYLVSGCEDGSLKIWSYLCHENIAFQSLEHLGKSKKKVCHFESLFKFSLPHFDKIFINSDGKTSMTSTFLNHLIEINAPDEMIEKIFKFPNPIWMNWMYCSNHHNSRLYQSNKPMNIIELLMELKREKTLKFILHRIVIGFSQYNDLRLGILPLSEANWMILPDMITSHRFTLTLCDLMNQYPDVCVEFFRLIGTVKALPDVDSKTLCQIRFSTDHEYIPRKYVDETELKIPFPNDSNFIVVGSDSTYPTPYCEWWDRISPESSTIETHTMMIAESRILPFSYAGGHPTDLTVPSLLDAAIKSGISSSCDNATIRTLIEYKWSRYGKRLFLQELLYYCLSLILLMVFLFLTRRSPSHSQHVSQPTYMITLLVLLDSLIQYLHECYEIFILGLSNYLNSEWKNLFDLIKIILMWVTCIGFLLGWKHYVVTLALLLLLKWFGLLYFLQAFSETGPLVRMILQIISDMKYFLVILLISVFGGSSAFYSLLQTPDSLALDSSFDNPFEDPGETLFYMFNMLILGNYDTESFVFGEYKSLVKILFVLLMILTLIILLNLLIALMGDSYSRIQDQSEIEFMMLRARLLVSMERKFTSKDRQKSQYFPKYYLLLVPLGDTHLTGPSSGSDQWSGMLKAMKREYRDSIKRVETQIDRRAHRFELEMENLHKALENQNRRLEDRMKTSHIEIMNALLHK